MTAISLVGWLSSSPRYSEASQIIPTINSVVQALNSGVLTQLNQLIYPTIPSAPVNLLGITSADTGNPVIINVDGQSVDTNAGLIVTARGTGRVSLGGAGTSATASLRVVSVVNSANYLSVQGATSASPTVLLHTNGASTDIGLNIHASGAGVVTLGGSGTSAGATLRVVTVTDGANYLQVTGATSAAPLVTAIAAGATTDIGLLIAPAGAGVLSLGGSTSANASLRIITSGTAAQQVTITGGATNPSIGVTGGTLNVSAGAIFASTTTQTTFQGAGIAIQGANTAAAASTVLIDQATAALSRWRSFGPDASTNGTLEIGTQRSDGSNPLVAISVTVGSLLRFNQYGAGTLTTDGSGNVTAVSEETMKDIKGNFTAGIAELRKIQPVTYKWKAETKLDTKDTYAGFGAANVEAAIPLATGRMKDGSRTLQDRAITAALVNAVKELDARITALEAA